MQLWGSTIDEAIADVALSLLFIGVLLTALIWAEKTDDPGPME